MAKNNPYALKFNGSNTGIRIPVECSLYDSSFTKMFWINRQDSTRGIIVGGYQVSGSANVGFEFKTDNTLRIYWDANPDIDTGVDTPLNDWFHITWIRDKDQGKQFIYIDGVLKWEHSSALTDRNATAGDYIGRDGRTGTTVFRGLMDNISFWNKALTEEEVQYYMNRKLSGREDGLIGYWTLDEGEGNIAYDSSPNQNHGIIVNGEWVEGEVDLIYLPEDLDYINYDSKQKTINNTVLINWGQSFGTTRYELQYYRDGWVTVNNNITDTEYVYTFTEPNSTAKFRVRGVNENGESDWIEGEEFEVALQSYIESSVTVNPYNKMRGYVEIIGVGDSDLDSNLTVRQSYNEYLDTSLTITKKHVNKDIESTIVVAQRDYDELDSSIALNPSGRMRGYVDIVAPVKKVLKIYPVKDSVVRQSAPTINYGHSQQMLAGESGEGKFISYLGFDFELPEDIDIESIKLVLHKQYETSRAFFMGLYETSNEWEEYGITWVHRPLNEDYVTQFVMPTEVGRVDVDLTNYYQEGNKSFIIRPRSYNLSELTTFGTRESINPPYIEVTYYDILGSPGSYSIDSSITVRRKVIRDISADINVESSYINEELEGSLEIVENKDYKDLHGIINVSNLSHSDVGGGIELEAKPQETEIDTTMIVPYREFLESNINLERKDRSSDIDTEISIRAFTTEELEGNLEIKDKDINEDLDSSITVKEDKDEELYGSLSIENKYRDNDIDSSILIGAIESSSIDSSLNIDKKNKEDYIISDIIVRGFDESSIYTSLEVPKIDAEDDLDSSIYVKFRSCIDSSVEVPKIDSQDEVAGELVIEKKPLLEDIDSDMTVRVFWVNEIESSLTIVRDFEIDASIEVVTTSGNYAFII